MRIEDIYPLTVVAMRHGKFAIVQAYNTHSCVTSLQDNEECQYNPYEFMKYEWEHIIYGIGGTIQTAFEDYKTRM